MTCRACRARLTYADNYCRKCGAAIEFVDVQVVRSTSVHPAATLRQAALPAVKQGASVIVAGALLRVAVKYLLWPRLSGRASLPGWREPRRAEDGAVVEELLYYRRVRSR